MESLKPAYAIWDFASKVQSKRDVHHQFLHTLTRTFVHLISLPVQAFSPPQFCYQQHQHGCSLVIGRCTCLFCLLHYSRSEPLTWHLCCISAPRWHPCRTPGWSSSALCPASAGTQWMSSGWIYETRLCCCPLPTQTSIQSYLFAFKPTKPLYREWNSAQGLADTEHSLILFWVKTGTTATHREVG